MATHTATQTNGKPTSDRTGFRLACPKCGEAQAEMHLDLTDCETVECKACDETFTVYTAVKEFAARLDEWQRLARWINLADVPAAPTTDDEEF